ncbi:hypothetical protein [Microbacterium maritypicum]
MSGTHRTDREREFLIAHGGLSAADYTPEALAQTNAAVEHGRAAADAEARAHSLTLSEAATLLGWPRAEVLAALAAGDMYSVPGEPPSVAPLFPRWQFRDGCLVPSLKDILATLPADDHPLDVEQFMTRANADYLDGTPPVDWLVHGRELGPVLRYADDLSWE